MTDEAEIGALVGRLSAAWDSGDADAYADNFTEQADYVVFDGTHLKGRAAIADVHRSLFQGFLRGSRLLTEEFSIQRVSEDVAIVHSRGAVLRRGQTRPSKRALSVQTLVAVKRDGRWRFTAFQNTRFRPFAKTLLGRLLTAFAPAPGRSGALPGAGTAAAK